MKLHSFDVIYRRFRNPVRSPENNNGCLVMLSFIVLRRWLVPIERFAQEKKSSTSVVRFFLSLSQRSARIHRAYFYFAHLLFDGYRDNRTNRYRVDWFVRV